MCAGGERGKKLVTFYGFSKEEAPIEILATKINVLGLDKCLIPKISTSGCALITQGSSTLCDVKDEFEEDEEDDSISIKVR